MDEGSVDSVTRIRLKKPDARRDDGERPSIPRLAGRVPHRHGPRDYRDSTHPCRALRTPLATRSPSLRAFAASSAVPLGELRRGLLLHEVRVRLQVRPQRGSPVGEERVVQETRLGVRAQGPRGEDAVPGVRSTRINLRRRVVLGGARERVPHPRFAVSPQVARHAPAIVVGSILGGDAVSIG